MVIPEQKGIDVFVNKGGAISITQSDPSDGPSCVVIQPSNLNLLIKALREAKKSIENSEFEVIE
jgi:hypothetical protein